MYKSQGMHEFMRNYSNTEARGFLERHRLSPATSTQVGPTPGFWMMKGSFVHINYAHSSLSVTLVCDCMSHIFTSSTCWGELNCASKNTHPDFGRMSMKSCWCVRGTNFTQVPLSTFSIALCISLVSRSSGHLKGWTGQTNTTWTVCDFL